MKITYGREANDAYIYLVEIPPGGVKKTYPCDPTEVEPGLINLDFDGEARLLGIEILGASKALPSEVLNQAEVIGRRLAERISPLPGGFSLRQKAGWPQQLTAAGQFYRPPLWSS